MAELTRRYVVMAMAAAAPFDPADHDAPFVLKPWKDPAALIALKSYRDHCYPELARDLDEWIRRVEAGPLALGSVGRRNDEHLASVRRVRGPRGTPSARGKAKATASPRAKGRGKTPRSARPSVKPRKRRR
jgi:hypothetical protein